jgi:hypothetical protein
LIEIEFSTRQGIVVQAPQNIIFGLQDPTSLRNRKQTRYTVMKAHKNGIAVEMLYPTKSYQIFRGKKTAESIGFPPFLDIGVTRLELAASTSLK